MAMAMAIPQEDLNLCMLVCLGSLKFKGVEINESVKNELKKMFIKAITGKQQPDWSVRKMRSPIKRRLNTSALLSFASSSAKPESDQESDHETLAAKASKKRKKLSITKKVPEEKGEAKNGPEPPPEMPTGMRVAIGIGNKSVRLILQKKIKNTDVEKNQNRLLMPVMQLRGEAEFLNPREAKEASRKEGKRIPGLRVKILDPRLQDWEITFKKWDMASSTNYLFNGTWSGLVEANGIQKDDVVQVWFYRDAHGNPCFALVNLTRPLD